MGLAPDLDNVQLEAQLNEAINAMVQCCGGRDGGAHSPVDIIAQFESVLAAAREAGDEKAQLTCNQCLEALYTVNGQTGASIASQKECLRLTGSPADKALAYKGIGKSRLDALDYQSALGSFEQAKGIAEGANLDRTYACLSEIGLPPDAGRL